MNTADTILQQLGGNRFIAMTGARHFCGSDTELQFHLPRGGKADCVRVHLNGRDLYDVTFYKIGRGLKVKTVSESSDVYADRLRATFEAATGLATSL